MENAHPQTHSHPTSPASTLHCRSRSIGSLSIRDRSANPSAITPKSVPHTRQQRLLHTRHARFSAQRLSVNTIAFPQLIRSSENDSSAFTSPRFTKQDENIIHSDRTSELTGSSPTSTILNEIANFAACRRRSPNSRAPIPVFKDSPDQLDTPHRDQHASSEGQAFSTESVEGSLGEMGLKEVSVNLRRPPSNNPSPHYASLRSSARRRASQTKPRFNSEEYIQHIENELQMVKDAMYSPNTHLPWKEKLKKAKQENDQLKKELEDLQSAFECELRSTVERLTENELRLKRRVRDLEDDVEQRDVTIQELEYHREESRLDQGTVDALKARIDKLEEERASLEITNRGMTKRNEVLTQLLALSPTKTTHGLDFPTPRRRSARPMSLIIPRVPSSPIERTPLSRPQSVLISPGHAVSDYFQKYSLSSPLAASPGPPSSTQNDFTDDTQSVDSGLGESCARSTNAPASRRSTLASHVSNSPDLPPISHQPSLDRPVLPPRQPSKRRPRKFMPGSTQLKPLLLATFTAENGNLPCASPLTSPQRSTQTFVEAGQSGPTPWDYSSQHVNDAKSEKDSPPVRPEEIMADQEPTFQSLDEVFARMGETLERIPDIEEHWSDQPDHPPRDHSRTNPESPEPRPIATPVDEIVPRPRIRSWVLKTTPTPPGGPNAIYDHGHPGLEQYHGHVLGEVSPDLIEGAESDLELSSVEIPRPLFSKSVSLSIDQAYLVGRSHLDQSPLNPRKRRKASSRTDIKLPSDENPLSDPVNDATFASGLRPQLTPRSIARRAGVIEHPHRRSTLMHNNRNPRTRSPLEMLQQRNIGSRPIAVITIQTIYATLSKYTSYIQTFKQDPLALARRVIANAWRSNWAVFGKMSWWVLGLFISRRRPISSAEWDWDIYDGESIAHRFCSEPDDADTCDEIRGVDDIDLEHTPSRTKSATPCESARSQKTPKSRVTASKPGWGTSLLLWGKFSVAIMLAVGGAIVRGPGEMLRETEDWNLLRPRSNSIDHVCSPAPPESTVISRGNSTLLERLKEAQLSRSNHSSDQHRKTTAIRKVRSFSSPASSTGCCRATVLVRESVHQDPVTAEVNLHRSSARVQDAASADGVNDDTLKPKAAQRTGIQSFFQFREIDEMASSRQIPLGSAFQSHESLNLTETARNLSDHG